MTEVLDIVVVGAGPAGLGCAGALRMRGVGAVVLEKGAEVGAVWRRHYDRLHLHTAKAYSGLPGLPMPGAFPRYPSREQVVDYLEDYARHHRIDLRLGTEVREIRREGNAWEVETGDGTLQARQVVLCGGIASFPKRADWPGLETFPGAVLHSSDYRNPTPFAGQRVLVVGFGNSGGEISMDLARAGVETALAVRSPVNVVPRDVLGIPAQAFSIAQRHLPYRLVDGFNGAISRVRMGDIRKLGLPRATKGPIAQIVEDKRIPLIDIGTIDCIREGLIAVRPGIERIEAATVHFTDRVASEFDAIVLATGFRPDLRDLLPEEGERLDATGAPLVSGADSLRDGLAFCGYKTVPTGHLREIGIEARALADALAE